MALYSFTIEPNESQSLPNTCAYGYIKNTSTADTANFILYGEGMATLSKTLQPGQTLTFSNFYVYKILNKGPGIIEIYFSPDKFSVSESPSSISINGTADINIKSNSLGNLPISIDTTNITGNINIDLAANSLGNLPIEIAANSLGNLPISIDTTNITGNINIDLAANSLGNLPIELAANTLGNLDININAQSIGNLTTDIGNTSLDNQENQTSGTNIYTYNPWGFNTSSTPSIRSLNVGKYSFNNVQQNNARGYLSFIFYVYNPTSTSGSTTISVNLYSHLPETQAPSPIMSFSFNTGTIDATSGVWLQVTPSIFWEYNTLVVIPEQQSCTENSTIGIGIPSNFNNINSHYWRGSYWDNSDDGFIGYWEIWNTSVASLPVTVQGGEVTITSTRKNPITIKGSFTGNNTTSITPPINKKWKIRSIVLYWTAGATQTDYVEIQIVPNNVLLAYVLNLYYGSLSVTDGDSYSIDVAEYVQSRTNQTINGSTFSLTEQTVNKELELYSTEALYLTVQNETATVDYYVSYIEENIN